MFKIFIILIFHNIEYIIRLSNGAEARRAERDRSAGGRRVPLWQVRSHMAHFVNNLQIYLQVRLSLAWSRMQPINACLLYCIVPVAGSAWRLPAGQHANASSCCISGAGPQDLSVSYLVRACVP